MPAFVFCLQNGMLRESLYSRLRGLDKSKIACKGALLYCDLKNEEERPPELSLLLADFILADLEKYFIWEKAYTVFDCFSAEERKLLADKAIRHAAGDTFSWSVFSGPRRREKLAHTIEEQLRRSHYLDLDGFITFRMSGYKEYLLAVLAVVADDYLGRQEDQDYRLLLNDILTARRPYYKEIHLLLSDQGHFQVYKKEKGGLVLVESGKMAGFEDLLVSEMIMLAPGKLFLYCEKEQKNCLLKRSLADAFSDRLICREAFCLNKD